MIQSRQTPNAAVRALFVIDPQGKLRAMLYYPMTVGRSVSEVLRLVQALQTVDRLEVVTPEGWIPGEDTVERPPQTVEVAEERRRAEGHKAYGCVDWYYYKRPQTSDRPAEQN
jgi:peroxiredoxin (alkyl hydroperoxide reductase subunit C)